ncbi:MAG TPA: helix-turn-helix transcriptional regulator [Actinomycetes bacterium]|nr:helix-turn-helix transcriptional regulator [Actinomycetes bacterium]
MKIEDFDAAPVFAISVVAQLTGMHPQTLRQYDRVGLVTPQRTSGGGRRYSARDVERLREIQHLSGEGIGLTGVKRILDLERHADELQQRVHRLEAELAEALQALASLHQKTTPGTDVVLRDRAAVVVWRRPPRSTL